MNKLFRSLVFYLFILVITVAVASWFTEQGPQPQKLTYSEFYQEVVGQRVATAVFVGRQSIEGAKHDGTEFTTVVPPDAQQELVNLMLQHGVRLEVRQEAAATFWSTLLYSLLPVVLVLAAFFFIMQQSQGSGNRVMQFGRSRARLQSDDRKRVTFEDVAGIDEVKEELEEIVDFLKHPKRYLELGARIPKGVLLFGAPGTGKTLLARAVAGEAGVPFFTISGSDFVEMFVGVGASRVRDLFDQAKKNSPCIVFIDEIDAVGRQRGAGYGGGHDEREQTLNQLLVEMDGFGVNEGIIIMAATNRPDVLDPALLRPGRFDRHIVIDRPDLEGRKRIFQVHAKGKPLAEDVDLAVMARRTPGFTGADIANVMNEAALLAARQRKREISMGDLEAAVDRVLAGGPEKKSRVLGDEERERVAYHEAGHALLSRMLPNCDKVHKVSIIPRGQALGYVLSLPVEDRYLIARSELVDRMVMIMGGRAAEEIIYGEISNGATDDIEKVTRLARRMVTEYGMSERLGPLTFGTKQDEVFLGRDIARQRNYGEDVAALIDDEVRALVMGAYEQAMAMLRQNRPQLERIARELLARETLDGPALDRLLAADEPGEAATEEQAS